MRPVAQRIYINALWRARVCEKRSSSYVFYTKCDIIIIRYRARPGCVLLVLHTAKRVVTTGALPSAGSGGPPSFPPRRTPHPHHKTHPHARAHDASTNAAAGCRCARVHSCCTRVKYCIGRCYMVAYLYLYQLSMLSYYMLHL